MRSYRPAASPEDAPSIPIRRHQGEVPQDPAAVEFDFAPDEIPVEALEFLDPPKDDLEDEPDTESIAMEELGDDAIEAADDDDVDPVTEEELEAPHPIAATRERDRRLAAEASAPATDPAPLWRAAATPPAPKPTAAPAQVRQASRPPSARHLLGVPVVFLGSMLATVLVMLLSWFIFLSPRLHAVQAAQLAALQAQQGPQVVEVKIPTPVPVPVIERVLVNPDGTDFVEGAAVAAPEPPAPTRAPAPRAAPPTPTKPAPTPAPIEQAHPDPVEEPEVAVAIEEPVPEAPPKPKPAAPTPAPAEARALNGRYGGSVSGMPLLFDLEFLAAGSLRATIQRGVEEPVVTMGRYALSGDRATIAIVEPVEGGASYSATVTDKGASGRISYPSGKNQRLSLDR